MKSNGHIMICLENNFRAASSVNGKTFHEILLKRRLFQIRKLYVSPDDRQLILQIMDLALSQTEGVKIFEPVRIAFKFDARYCSERMDLSLKLQEIRFMLRLQFHLQSLFWSRFGIQDWVGKRSNIVFRYLDFVLS